MALITLNDVKTELNMTEAETDFDKLLTLMTAAVQSIFEEKTDRMFSSAVFTEYHHGETNLQYKIFTKNFPILSITSIHDDSLWVYGSDTLIASSNYSYDAESGIIHIDGGIFEGFNNIKLVYIAGYTTLSLPKGIKQVWIRQAAHWFKDAKDSDWAKSSITTSQGSTVKRNLKDNLLPDFNLLASLNSR